MIVVWGALDDPPIHDVLEALRARAADVLHLDRSQVGTLDYDVSFGPAPSGWISSGAKRIAVEAISAIYLRPEAQRVARGTRATACLLALASSLDAVVINRPTAGRSNLSKPLQLAAIAAAGFAVPPTLVTTDPSRARRFLQRYGRIVYKSVSGIRSIVSTLDAADTERLSGVSTGPVQLQQWIDGIDVRVHVVGDQCFAAAIESTAADYRYGDRTSIVATEIDADLGRRIVRMAQDMGLLVVGVDLRVTPDDEWFCFEVNPSPGFTFYEDATGQPITAAVADLLMGRAATGEGQASTSR